jgi:hypothetical protein
MTRFRMPLALLFVGAVLLGGCDPASEPATQPATGNQHVDQLLDEVDRQLDGDAQPAADQD